MRIAIVVLNLDIGGTQRVGVDLANAFSDAGNETHLITFGNKEVLLKPNKNVLIHKFYMQKSLKQTLIAIPFLVLAKMINILIRKSFFYFNGLMMSVLFKYKMFKLESKYGKFNLIIFRGNSVFELVWALNDKRILQGIDNMDIKETKNLYEKIHAKLTLSDKNIVPISKEIEENLNNLIVRNSIKIASLHTIYGPLDKNNIISLTQEYIPDIKEKYIVSIGRLAKVKNLELLLKAYKYAYENIGLKHKLVIVGDGETKESLISLVKEYALDDKVVFTGSLANPYPWLIHADLFVTTSYSEGLGMTVLEALACDVKVISTKSQGGIKEIMKDELQEYMIDFSDKLLAEKIVETLNETKKWDFEKYIKEFSPKEIVDQYKKYYYDKINI